MQNMPFDEIKNILVVRTDRIGDLILTTPVFENLRRYFSHTKIAGLVSANAGDILKNNPNVDEIIKYNDNYTETLALLKKNKYDLCFVVYPTFQIAKLCFSAGIKYRVGVGFRWYSFLFNRKIYFHRSKVEMHEMEYNLKMLSDIWIPVLSRKCYVGASEKAHEKVKAVLSEKGIKEDEVIVGVHPGSGKSSKNWSPHSYIELVKLLKQLGGVRVILTFGEREGDLAEEVKKQLGFEPIIIAGLSVEELVALISKYSLLISGSTGPMHIAGALGVRTLSFFSPVFVDSPKRWGPIGNENFVFMPEVGTCKVCDEKKCGHFDCMDSIKPETVFLKVREILNCR